METQELQRLKNKYDIIGNDAALNIALETAAAVAPTDLTVLISGESGVGKDVIPQLIHQMSRRRNGKYLAVNCGAIPEGTISAELFGHEKGSFTGAIAERKGYFEEANGGTLFLDEIGELPKETQAMLLRVLQSGEYIKVGSSKVEKTDVRVIAATNVNLLHAVSTGKFREDLYYRLNAIQIKMPALRDRRDDIYLLFRKFTSDFSEKYGICKVSLTHDAISALRQYRWPGNIRQLKNIAETVSALESKPVTPTSERVELGLPEILKYIPDEKDTLLPAMVETQNGGGGLRDEDREMIAQALMKFKTEIDDLRREVNELKAGASNARPLPQPVVRPSEPQDVDEVEWEEPQREPSVSSVDMSIRKANDEMIERALEKHAGKVKLAAAELGISERTIYRKLAEKKTRQ